MASSYLRDLPALPLLLWGTPPGLEQILSQEGVAFRTITDPHALAFGGGRFVLFDGREVSSRKVRARLSSRHVALDVDVLRRESPGVDPFLALIDPRAARKTWDVRGSRLTERVSRFNKAEIRTRLIARIRDVVTRAGGVWARLSAYPHPYRAAFNFRADLDEPHPDDYFRFAQALRPLDDCATLFVSTHAYGRFPEVLDDLRRIDAQSHGHFHVVYRRDPANRRNVEASHNLLKQKGFHPVGFAAPEGRWSPGLDRILEEFGYEYASDFGVGHDDLPFFPHRGEGFSRVLQVPVHPICEGLFLDAGADDPRLIAAHLIETVRRKVAGGEPAFIYGHPERRLGRFPEVVSMVAEAVAGLDLLWRVRLTDFARWWKWRAGRRWSLLSRGEGRYALQFEDWDSSHPLALEVVRGPHTASVPILGPSQPLAPADLIYERKAHRVDPPQPTAIRPRRGLKDAVRAALDWETVTPLDDLPEDSIRDRLKKRLRRWKAGVGAREEVPHGRP